VTDAPLAIVELGLVPYGEARALQQQLREERIAGRLDRDVLLLLEHEPTITLGRGTRPSSLPLPPGELATRGLTVAEIERGGDVTWHGPGQLVGYPILDLTCHRPDLHWYLRRLEATLIVALDAMGIAAEPSPGQTGVWTRGRKIASIGVHVRRWITMHGFALNVTNTLEDFGLIVPCGIAGVEMTSVCRELGSPADGEAAARTMHGARQAVRRAFGEVFQREGTTITLDQLRSEGTVALPPA
jgi:lipoate-protein ligase B